MTSDNARNSILSSTLRSLFNMILASAVISTLLFPNTALSEPSFECGNATNRVEHLICDNSSLGRYDRILSEAYQNARELVDDPKKLKETQRDWLKMRNRCETIDCLREIYWDRIVKLRDINFRSRTGQYKISNGWPTGVRNHIYTLPEEEKQKCRVLGKMLALEKMSKPARCEIVDNHEKRKDIGVEWLKVSDEEALNFAKTVREQKSGVNNSWSEEVKQGILKDIKTQTLVVSKSYFDLFHDGHEVEVLKFETGTCSDSHQPSLRVEYAFRNKDGELSVLSGLGNPNEVFIWRDRGYFVSHSDRSWDDSFEYKLEPEQPVIFIHRVSSRDTFSRMCRFIFWDEQDD